MNDKSLDQLDGVSVHSGFPNAGADNTLSGLSLDRLLITRPASTFFIRIAGDNWTEQGIFDGDIAVIDRALDPRRNDTVIWYATNNELMISSVRTVAPEGRIWGVVTSVIHRLRS